MNPLPTLVGLLVLSLGLAGCHAPAVADGDDHSEPATQAITFTVLDAPANATVGVPFQMTVDVAATVETSSVHSGFHWSTNSTTGMTGLTGGSFSGASPHVTESTAFPGSYTIPEWTPTADMIGTIYVRAHTNADDMDWWGNEFAITVNAA